MLCVVITLALASCGYSKEDLRQAEAKGYQEGYEEGYDLAKYEAKVEIENVRLEESVAAFQDGYDHGYEVGYEEGFRDCMGGESTYDPNNAPRIEKERD